MGVLVVLTGYIYLYVYYLHNYRWFKMVFFQNFITTKLMFWGWSPKTPWGFGTPVQLDPKIRKSSGWLAPSGTNKGWPKTPDQQGFFPIRTITTTRTISIQNEHRVSLPFPKAPKTKKQKQKRHESSRIKLLVVITSVVKPLPELLPGDRLGVCELRLGRCAWRGGWEFQKSPKIQRENTGSRTYRHRHTDCKPEEVEMLYHSVLEKGEAKEKLSRLLLSCWVVSWCCLPSRSL